MSKPGALASSTDNAPLQRTPSRPVMARPFEGGNSSPTMLRHENGSPSRDSKGAPRITVHRSPDRLHCHQQSQPFARNPAVLRACPRATAARPESARSPPRTTTRRCYLTCLPRALRARPRQAPGPRHTQWPNRSRRATPPPSLSASPQLYSADRFAAARRTGTLGRSSARRY